MSKQVKTILANEVRATGVIGRYRTQVRSNSPLLVDALAMREAADYALGLVAGNTGTVLVTDWEGNEKTYAIGEDGQAGEAIRD